MKVLFIPAWYPSETHPVSGIFIQEHAKAVSLYNDVIVLYSERVDDSLEKIDQYQDSIEDGIRTLRIKYRKYPIPKTTYFIYLWSIWKGFRYLLRKGWKPDIIHAHVYTAGVPAILLGKMYKIPISITEHWTGFPRHTLRKIDTLKARFAMNRAKCILSVSKNLERAIKSYGIKNQFEVVPNAVNTSLFYPSAQRNNHKIKKMLFVALLSPQKGVPYLIQTLAQLKQKRQDFILDVVGDGPKREEYVELSKELGLEGVVKFYGLKTKLEIAEFMREYDFFVLPSFWENLPCVLIEAIASGLPIVATNVGGIPEMLNETNSILIEPGNIKELYNSIDYMLDHYQEYSPVMISQYAKENFSYETVGRKISDIYQSIKVKV